MYKHRHTTATAHPVYMIYRLVNMPPCKVSTHLSSRLSSLSSTLKRAEDEITSYRGSAVTSVDMGMLSLLCDSGVLCTALSPLLDLAAGDAIALDR